MGLLSMLGINLPGLGSSPNANPFSSAVSGGNPVAPNQGATGFSTLIPQLIAMTQGAGSPGGVAPTAAGPQAPPVPQVQPKAGAVQPPAMFVPPVQSPAPAQAQGPAKAAPANWGSIRSGIFKGESGGDYNTLYGHTEQKGPFAGTKVTDMTVDQALAFGSHQGPYGKWAQSQGISAAPMGAYQIINSTLQKVKEGMGLTGNELMTPALQEQMGQYIYHKQGTGAWAGYKGPGDPNAFPSGPAFGPTSDAMSRPSGSEWSGATPYSSQSPDFASQSGGFNGTGDFNSAQLNARAPAKQHGKGIPGADPGNPQAGGGGTTRNSFDANYQKYATQKTTRHLRGLSPVATIQALADIGKGLRVQGGGRA